MRFLPFQARRRLVLGLVTLMLAWTSIRVCAAEPRLAVAAASDLVFVLEELNPMFSQAHSGCQVQVSAGASGNLYAQLRQGAPFDVFLSADLGYPRELARAGLADTNSLFVYALGHLVLWTTRTNLDLQVGLHVLTQPSVRRIAIPNPETAPYGRAAREALRQANLWSDLQPKIVLADNLAQTAQFVQSGNVEVGLVGRSTVSAPKLRGIGTWWALPNESFPPLEQAGVLTRRGATNSLAQAYLQFLRSPQAKRVFEKYGFQLPASAAPPTQSPPPPQ